jgi:hypothetical protein
VFLPVKRATLLIPSGPEHDSDRNHLFILLTDGAGEPCQSALVSISSVYQGKFCDKTCLLHPGDHPFVRRPSFVHYREAILLEIEKLVRGVNDGKLIPRDPLGTDVFARVCQGVMESRYTPHKVKMFYRQYGQA